MEKTHWAARANGIITYAHPNCPECQKLLNK